MTQSLTVRERFEQHKANSGEGEALAVGGRGWSGLDDKEWQGSARMGLSPSRE